MKRPSQPRRTACLPESVLQQLNMYALAAGAAGVGMLALSRSAEAKVIYTPAHVDLGFHHKITYLLDLNHDGITDFTFSFYFHGESGAFESTLRIARGPNSVWGGKLANDTKPGSIIGTKRNFAYGSALMAAVGGTSNSSGKCDPSLFSGLWENQGKGVKNRYLGLRFMVKGEPHFGWARLTVTGGCRLTATLTGYAYETVPNRAIVAGKKTGTDGANLERSDSATLTAPISQPGSLGGLAMGASGLSIWRRESVDVLP
jgi:hypothetical protein